MSAKQSKSQSISKSAPGKPLRSPPVRFQAAWRQHVEELKDFKKEYGHCNVPRTYDSNRKLGVWVDNVRRRKKLGKLAREMVRELNGLGFQWTLIHRRFHRRDLDELVETLKAFKKEHGHCNFSLHVGADPDLVNWLKDVRKSKKFGRLPSRYVKELNRLGFVWRPREQFSDKMIADLAAYRKRYGNCRVPFRWPKNPALATWTTRMRYAWRQGKLPKDIIEKLDEIGFPWVLDSWGNNIGELKKFKKKHRHANVPTNYPANPKLARWAANVRNKKNQGDLALERVRQLNELGFRWAVRRSKKSKGRKGSKR